MEPLRQLNQAMEYIERNLTSEIDFEQAARLAGSSEYHFRRMFSFLSGMSLGEYVRRRRLALAALDLTEGNARTLDLALKYGYDSPDAFTRAFQALHGVTPTEARRNGIPLKAVMPMTFQLTIRGGEEMDYRIIEKEAFSIVGLRKRVTLQYNGVNPEIAAMWASLTPEDVVELKALSAIEPRGFLSGSLNFSEGRGEGTELDQVIGVAMDKTYEGKWQVLPVEPSTWAVFTVRGKFPGALQSVWGRIYSEWFPMSGYEQGEGPEILWNEGKDMENPQFHSEIWIPVVKKP